MVGFCCIWRSIVSTLAQLLLPMIFVLMLYLFGFIPSKFQDVPHPQPAPVGHLSKCQVNRVTMCACVLTCAWRYYVVCVLTWSVHNFWTRTDRPDRTNTLNRGLCGRSKSCYSHFKSPFVLTCLTLHWVSLRLVRLSSKLERCSVCDRMLYI